MHKIDRATPSSGKVLKREKWRPYKFHRVE